MYVCIYVCMYACIHAICIDVYAYHDSKVVIAYFCVFWLSINNAKGVWGMWESRQRFWNCLSFLKVPLFSLSLLQTDVNSWINGKDDDKWICKSKCYVYDDQTYGSDCTVFPKLRIVHFMLSWTIGWGSFAILYECFCEIYFTVNTHTYIYTLLI